MKKFLTIVTLALLVAGCDSPFTYDVRKVVTNVVDGCEYIQIISDNGYNGWEHKGNCTNCRAWMMGVISNQLENTITFRPYEPIPLPYYYTTNYLTNLPALIECVK